MRTTLLAVSCALAGAELGAAAPAPAASPAGVVHAGARAHVSAAATRHRPRHQTAAQRRKAELDRRLKQLGLSTLTLNSRFIHRAQVLGSILPFTLRLRKAYEAGPGDDMLALQWDTGVTPWPLAGTAPAPAASVDLDGAVSYAWDYGADVSGYGSLGTVETMIGGNTSMTGSGFSIAGQATTTCSGVAGLDTTGMSLTSGGMRFGVVNPFSRDVTGTINLRTTIRSKIKGCDGTYTYATAATTTTDPPLPVAFNGSFSVSPSIMADGKIRLGTLKVADTLATPQRSTFGLVQACTDATAADCARMAFPVRTKLASLTADVIIGSDAMPGPPAPPPDT